MQPTWKTSVYNGNLTYGDADNRYQISQNGDLFQLRANYERFGSYATIELARKAAEDDYELMNTSSKDDIGSARAIAAKVCLGRARVQRFNQGKDFTMATAKAMLPLLTICPCCGKPTDNAQYAAKVIALLDKL